MSAHPCTCDLRHSTPTSEWAEEFHVLYKVELRWCSVQPGQPHGEVGAIINGPPRACLHLPHVPALATPPLHISTTSSLAALSFSAPTLVCPRLSLSCCSTLLTRLSISVLVLHHHTTPNTCLHISEATTHACNPPRSHRILTAHRDTYLSCRIIFFQLVTYLPQTLLPSQPSRKYHVSLVRVHLSQGAMSPL